MPLVTTKQMLLEAQKKGYAVGAFNVENMEMVQAVVAAAEESGFPVIMQTTPSTLKYASPAVFFGNAAAVCAASKATVALHLDHGSSFELAQESISAGYTSVMIDGSKLALEDNIALTAKVVAAAHAAGIPVEAELGKVGGKEDDLVASNAYTDPDDAEVFVRESGCDSLAVAIGTAHGIYKGVPVLDVERLKAIRRVVEIPLILHGASGLSDDAVRECIREGICKVNFATELRIAYSDGVKATLAENPDVFDPKVYGKAGRERVKALVLKKIEVCRDGK